MDFTLSDLQAFEWSPKSAATSTGEAHPGCIVGVLDRSIEAPAELPIHLDAGRIPSETNDSGAPATDWFPFDWTTRSLLPADDLGQDMAAADTVQEADGIANIALAAPRSLRRLQ